MLFSFANDWIKKRGKEMTMTIVFYGLAAIGLILSLLTSGEKTKMALKKAWKHGLFNMM